MKKYVVIALMLLIIPFNFVSADEKTISQWESELNKVQKELDDTNTKKQNTGKNIYNNKLPEYRIDGQNKGESNWAEFISDVIIR